MKILILIMAICNDNNERNENVLLLNINVM